MSVTNSTGGTTGSQKIGGITVNIGKVSITRNKAEYNIDNPNHDGDFHGESLLGVASISGQYNDRFDDVGYYE